MEQEQNQRRGIPGWLIIVLLLLIILAKGIFSFLLVGDRGQPAWDYRPVEDVPASSPHGEYEPLPYPQHVAGEKGE
jgi:hypothetical protein